MQFNKNALDNFEIVKGKDIRYWYNVDNYSQVKGQLGSSCMRYDYCESINNAKSNLYSRSDSFIKSVTNDSNKNPSYLFIILYILILIYIN